MIRHRQEGRLQRQPRSLYRAEVDSLRDKISRRRAGAWLGCRIRHYVCGGGGGCWPAGRPKNVVLRLDPSRESNHDEPSGPRGIRDDVGWEGSARDARGHVLAENDALDALGPGALRRGFSPRCLQTGSAKVGCGTLHYSGRGQFVTYSPTPKNRHQRRDHCRGGLEAGVLARSRTGPGLFTEPRPGNEIRKGSAAPSVHSHRRGVPSLQPTSAGPRTENRRSRSRS